nr:MAG TPA: structural protein [Caudoviricetes sp.]
MSSENIIKRYPLDLTGKHPDNKISDELHVVDSRTRVFALKAGAFYTDSVKITYLGDHLVPNEQFRFVRLVEAAVKRSRKNVAMFVLITAEVRGEVHIEYQCVGGEFQEIPESLIEMLESHKHDARGIYYKDLIDKPTLFEPVRHLHSIYDIYGLNPIADPLNQLVAIQRERAAKADSILIMKLHQIEEKIKDVDFSKINEANIDALRVEVAKAKEIIDAIGDPSENKAAEEHFRHDVSEKLKETQTALDSHKASLAALGEKDIELTNDLDTAKTELGDRITETKNALDALSQLVASYKNSERKLVSDIPGANLANNDTMGFTLTIPRDPKIAEHDTAIGTLNTNLEEVRNLPRATPDDVTALRQAQDTLKGRVDGHDTKLAEHDASLQDHNTRINAVQDQANNTNTDLNQFKSDVGNHFTELEKGLTTLNTDIENEKSAREKAVADLQGKLDTTNQTVEANKQAIENSLNDAKQSLAQSINEAKEASQTNLDNAKQALDNKIDTEKATLQGNIDATNNNLTALQGKVNELKESSSGATDELKNKLDETKNALEAYKTANDAAVDVERKRIDGLSSDVTAYKTSNDEKLNAVKTKGEETANQLNALSADVKPRMTSAESRLAEVEAKTKANDAADAARDATIAQLKEKDIELSAKDAALEGSIQAVTDDLATAKTTLGQAIDTAKQEAQAANQALTNTVNANKEAADSQLSELTQKANALQTALDKTNETLKSGNSNATDAIQAANARIDELKKNSEAKDNELTNTLDTLGTKVTNHIAENTKKEVALDEAIDALKTRTAATDEALTTAKSELSEKIEALKNSGNDNTVAINAEIAALKEKDNILTSNIQTTNTALTEAKQTLQAKDTELERGLSAEVTRAKAREDEIEGKITQANTDRASEKQALESSINALKEKQASDKSTLEEKITAANQAHTELKQAVDAKTASDTEKFNALEEKATTLSNQITERDKAQTARDEALTAYKQDVAGKLTALEEKATASTGNASTLSDKIDGVKNDISAANEKIKANEDSLKEKTKDIAGLKGKADELNGLITANTNAIAGHTTEIAALKEKDTALQGNIDAANARIDTANSEIEKLKQSSASGISEAKEALNTRINEEAAKTAALDTRLGTAEGKLDAVTEKANGNATEIASAKEKISALEDKANAVSGKIDEKITAAITPINEKVGTLETAQTALSGKVDSAINDINANKGRLGTLADEIAAVRETATNNGNSIAAHAGKLTALETKDTELANSIQTEHDTNTTQDEKIAALESAKEDYKTRIEALETLKNEVNAKMAEQDGRFDLFATKKEVNLHVSNLAGVIGDVRKDLTAAIASGDSTTLSSANRYTDEKFKTASSRIDAASQSITNNYNELKGLVDGQSTAATQANGRIDTLSNKVTEQGTTIDGLTSRIQAQEGKTTDLTEKVQANTNKNAEQDTKISTLESNLGKVSAALESVKAVSGNVDALTAKLADATAAKEKAEANAGKIATLESSIASLGNDYILKSTRYTGWMSDGERASEENIRVLSMSKWGGTTWVGMLPSEINFHKHADPKSRIAGFIVDQNNGEIDFDKGAGIKAREVGLREEYWGHRTMRDIIDAMRDHLLVERGGHGLPEMTYREINDRFDKMWPALRGGLPIPNSKESDARIIRNPVKPKLDYYQGYQIDAILLGKIRQLLYYPTLDTGINYLNYGAMDVVNHVVQGWRSAPNWRSLETGELTEITLPDTDKEIMFEHGKGGRHPLWLSKEPLTIFKPGLYELTFNISNRDWIPHFQNFFLLYSKDGSNWNRTWSWTDRVSPIPEKLIDVNEHRYYRHKVLFNISEEDIKHAPFHLLLDFGQVNASANENISINHICVTNWRGPFLNTYIQGDKDHAEPVTTISANQAALIQAEVRRYVREQSQPQTNTLDISRFKVQPGAEDWSNVSAGENNTINVRGVVLQQFDGGETSVFAPSQVFQISEAQTWTVPATLVGKKAEIIVRAASKQEGDQIIHSAVRRTFVTLPNAQINLLAGELASFGQYLTVNVNQDYPDSLYPRTQVPASNVNQKQTAMITITV